MRCSEGKQRPSDELSRVDGYPNTLFQSVQAPCFRPAFNELRRTRFINRNESPASGFIAHRCATTLKVRVSKTRSSACVIRMAQEFMGVPQMSRVDTQSASN